MNAIHCRIQKNPLDERTVEDFCKLKRSLTKPQPSAKTARGRQLDSEIFRANIASAIREQVAAFNMRGKKLCHCLNIIKYIMIKQLLLFTSMNEYDKISFRLVSGRDLIFEDSKPIANSMWMGLQKVTESHNCVVKMEVSMRVGVLIAQYFRGALYVSGHRHFESHQELKNWLFKNLNVGLVTAR